MKDVAKNGCFFYSLVSKRLISLEVTSEFLLIIID
jgi:hypothetical protein